MTKYSLKRALPIARLLAGLFFFFLQQQAATPSNIVAGVFGMVRRIYGSTYSVKKLLTVSILCSK